MLLQICGDTPGIPPHNLPLSGRVLIGAGIIDTSIDYPPSPHSYKASSHIYRVFNITYNIVAERSFGRNVSIIIFSDAYSLFSGSGSWV